MREIHYIIASSFRSVATNSWHRIPSWHIWKYTVTWRDLNVLSARKNSNAKRNWSTTREYIQVRWYMNHVLYCSDTEIISCGWCQIACTFSSLLCALLYFFHYCYSFVFDFISLVWLAIKCLSYIGIFYKLRLLSYAIKLDAVVWFVI